VDFAHNEAGTEAILHVARGLAAGAPVTAIVGTAGDRPDDTLIGIGKLAGELADRVVLKETRKYLRGRDGDAVIGLLREGLAAAGHDAEATPLYATETAALAAVLTGDEATAHPRVVVLFCHEQRPEVFALLERLGARPLLDPVVAPSDAAGDR
jgi:cyanophycin synthetase